MLNEEMRGRRFDIEDQCSEHASVPGLDSAFVPWLTDWRYEAVVMSHPSKHLAELCRLTRADVMKGDRVVVEVAQDLGFT
jgi:hypothetical protein